MRRTAKIAAFLFAVIMLLPLFTSCERRESSYTLCIYMCGSDLETKRGAAGENISELLSAELPDNTDVIIQTGGAAKWHSYGIPSDGITRYRVESGELVQLAALPQANMGSGNTLADFLKFCTSTYPAERYGLILWDHGSGSAGSFCLDENYGMDGLTAERLESALSMALGDRLRLDFIGFDVCLAANYEAMSVSAGYADNMIASQEIESLGGWDYRVLAEHIGAADFYTSVLDSFAEKCDATGNGFYTLSHIDLSDMFRFNEAFDAFAEGLARLSEASLKSVTDAAAESMSFGLNAESEGYSDMIDLGDFARLTGAAFLEEELSRRITSRCGAYRDGASGLSLYYPLSGFGKLSLYLNRMPDNAYRRFLSDNYTGVRTDRLVTFTDRGSDAGGELHIAVTPESVKYIQRVEYRAFHYYTRSDGYTRWISYGADTDIDSDGVGGYTTSCGAKWVRFGDVFVCCYPIDRTGTKSLFAATCSLNGEVGTVRFTYDLADRSFHTLGFIGAGQGGGTDRMVTVGDDDEIRIMFYEQRTDGSLQLCDGAQFAVSPEMRFNVGTIPDGLYRISVVVTDIFGNRYTSDTAEMTVSEGMQHITDITDLTVDG